MNQFTDVDAWNGGHYELAIELGNRSDQRLRSALWALWGHPNLSGPYAHDDVEPDAQTPVDLADSPLELKLFGLATIPEAGTTTCLTVPIRFGDGIDWLYFCVPLGGLDRVLPVRGFPFERSPPGSWVVTLEDWLATLGQHVFVVMDFPLAVIGFETDTEWRLDEVREGPRSESFLVPRGENMEFLRRGPTGR